VSFVQTQLGKWHRHKWEAGGSWENQTKWEPNMAGCEITVFEWGTPWEISSQYLPVPGEKHS